MNLVSSIFFSWFAIVFCISGLFINFLQLLVLPLYWIKKSWYHNIIPALSYGIFSQITVLGEWWAGMDLKVYVESTEDFKHVGKESSVIICNHYSDIDWLASWIFSDRNGFCGRAKVISKNSIKYVPVIGWSWWFAEFGFLNRNWQQDKENISRIIESMRNNTNYFWMGLLCEGTRRTDEKLKASQEFSLNNGIVPLKHHLLPRTKGFSLIVEGLHDKVPAIYDFELGFPNPKSATLMNIFNRGKIEVLLHFRRIPMCNLPKSQDELSKYIIQHYREKDVLYETFLQTGKFPGTLVPLPRKINNLVLFTAVNVLVGLIIISWISYCVIVFGIGFVGLAILVTCFVVYAFMRFVTIVSKSDRGSKFGLEKK
ncbi:1-acyl-sn-glycerol-3-phosphate acyltransferase delta isoform X2 [Hydra vulgaris]|uniref:1-acyl-sn-glycerol-3-phosphate acyltransferase delta isoform X2 n=2 Tax=Hydra vulgaris TaxID=6087 RepID=A0ABM4BHW6_HYDVU